MGRVLPRKPGFFSEPVAIGEVHGHHFLELLQQPGRLGSVLAVALQLRHMLALIGYLALGLSKVTLSGRDMIFKH